MGCCGAWGSDGGDVISGVGVWRRGVGCPVGGDRKGIRAGDVEGVGRSGALIGVWGDLGEG